MLGYVAQLFRAGLARHKSLLTHAKGPERTKEKSEVATWEMWIEELEELDPADLEWHGEMTCIVARKAVLFDERGMWMRVRSGE